ncbi:hypothetical protein DID88_009340 [Monilinia fructigena]|uniref:Secreted protein n=1 Tax=Monilinia fructigena TaxID=38457 RepID=A0A395IMA5_9HELO|nr:hypothetical protein DID88_009340 [Monilinia fructigena]
MGKLHSLLEILMAMVLPWASRELLFLALDQTPRQLDTTVFNTGRNNCGQIQEARFYKLVPVCVYAQSRSESHNHQHLDKPLRAMVDTTGKGGFSKSVKAVVTTQIPALSAGITCTGTVAGHDQSNVCMAKMANPSKAGPFGGCAAVQQSTGTNTTGATKRNLNPMKFYV